MDEFKKISFIYNSLTGSGSQVIDVPHVAEVDCSLLYERISEKEGLSEDLFEITLNGKHLKRYSTCAISGKDGFQVLSLYSPLIAGKGGFGSMLRAIGAQIEKTTNKEACRDLSGRRLRDINAEKRIKEWISQRANRQEEEERKRKDKLLKLKEEPKLEFKDDEYFKVKEEIPEKVEEALNYGLKVVESAEKPAPVKKAVSNKGSLWIGVDLDESDEDDDVKEPSEGSQPENPEEPSTSGVKRTLNELPQPKRQKC